MLRWLVGMSAVALLAGTVVIARANAGPSRATRLATIHAEGAESHRGIGLVRLDESHAQVTRALGPGRKVSSGSDAGESFADYRYRSGPIVLTVTYATGRVVGVDTRSPGAILFGHRLSEGLSTFKAILRHRHGWRIDACNYRVFTALAPGGPGTGIEWKAGKLELVQIDVGGVLDDCAFL